MDQKKSSLIGFLFLLFIGAFLIFKNSYNDKLLSNSQNIYGVLIDKQDGSAVHGSASGTFEYTVHNKKINFTESGNFMFMNIGDSVLIKYAIADPSVATVVDKYVMQKYKHLK